MSKLSNCKFIGTCGEKTIDETPDDDFSSRMAAEILFYFRFSPLYIFQSLCHFSSYHGVQHCEGWLWNEPVMKLKAFGNSDQCIRQNRVSLKRMQSHSQKYEHPLVASYILFLKDEKKQEYSASLGLIPTSCTIFILGQHFFLYDNSKTIPSSCTSALLKFFNSAQLIYINIDTLNSRNVPSLQYFLQWKFRIFGVCKDLSVVLKKQSGEKNYLCQHFLKLITYFLTLSNRSINLKIFSSKTLFLAFGLSWIDCLLLRMFQNFALGTEEYVFFVTITLLYHLTNLKLKLKINYWMP